MNNQGYIDEMHDDVPCFPCETSMGTALAVVAGGADAIVNFDLMRGGQIAGQVTDTSVPPRGIDNVAVQIFDAAGRSIGFSSRSAGGGFYSSTGFPAGTYFARVLGLPGDILHPRALRNITCSGCSPLTGSPITVATGVVTANIDFALARGPRIAGQVREASADGRPIANVTVTIFNERGLQASTAATGASGDYMTPDGLVPGTYIVRNT